MYTASYSCSYVLLVHFFPVHARFVTGLAEPYEAVSETFCRNGNSPVRLVSVDMEAALKAGHAEESAKETQFCAMVVGILLASNAHSANWGEMLVDFRFLLSEWRCDVHVDVGSRSADSECGLC